MNIPTAWSAAGDERGRVIDLITLSFASDPLARWALPEAGQYLRVMPRWIDADHRRDCERTGTRRGGKGAGLVHS